MVGVAGIGAGGALGLLWGGVGGEVVDVEAGGDRVYQLERIELVG